jgi:phosphatidylserine/phosphatidylglycerophosphate/cardiolipin synthase-like enzyme
MSFPYRSYPKIPSVFLCFGAGVVCIVAAGCNSSTAPAAQPTASPQVALGTMNSFPSTTIGIASPAQSVTLTNSGNASLTVSGISITGANASSFSETTTCSAVLSAGNSCSISVIFTPAAAGNLAAAISVADNATGSPHTVALAGTGIPVQSAQAVLSATSISFPNTTVGSTSAVQMVTLSNPGTLTLNLSGITLTGANAADFASTNNCGISLSAGTSCTISASFTPAATGTFAASISVADSAAASPQTIALAGTGTPALVAQAVLSPTSLTFPNTASGTTSAAMTSTLSNPGTLALNISGVTVTGANASAFAQTNNCGSSLTPAATCTISATFTPPATGNYSAAVSIADNAAGSPQSLPLSGSSAAAGVTHTLLTFPESDLSVTPIYNYIMTAGSTLDMTMYELVDTSLQQDLATIAAKGVKVRVVLDQSLEKISNTAAYNYLNANGVQAVWANSSFQACHQKTITIDGKSTMIMTLNLTSRYYNDTRDFAVIDTSPNDVAAIETVFNNDFANGATNFSTPYGDDLIWSPTNSQTALLALIASAKVSLNVENEEMGDAAIVNALVAAAKSGVQVQVTMTSDGSYNSEFTTLKAAGVKVSTYTETAPLYIHAKVILVDYGQAGQQAFVGSENFSNASLMENRELGLTLTDATVLQSLNTTLNADFAGTTPY